jgi:hypothetical protein
MPFPIPSDATTTQNKWRFCDLCHGLFWDGDQRTDPHPTGSCPGAQSAGGGHEAAGWDFYLLANPNL